MAGRKKWSRAVWREGDQEEELVIPSSWIEGKFIRWPNSSSALAALKDMRKPEKTWQKFNLIKVKFSSDSKKECDQYDYTTTGETTEEESDIEEEMMPKRRPKKRIFSDFILDGVESTEEESCGTGSTEKHKKRIELPPPPPLPSLATRRLNSDGSRSPPRSDIVHQRSQSPASTNRSNQRSVSSSRSYTSEQRSRSPATSNRSGQRSRSPATSNRSDQRSRSPATSNRSGQRSRSPATSNRSGQRSRSPATSNRSGQRSRSPATSNRSCQRSRSPATSNRSCQRSRSPATAWSNRCHQQSISPAGSNRSEQRSRSHGSYSRSRSPSWFNTPRQRSRSPTRADRSFQHSRSPSAERSSRSHRRSRTPTRSERSNQSFNSGSLRSTQSLSTSGRRSKTGSLTVFPLTEEKFQRKTIFLLTEIRDLLQNSQRTEAHSQLPGSEFNFSVVDTIDDLNSVERSLEDKDFRTKMKTMLMKVGGMDEADGVKKCMQRCLSNAMMARMNLRGNKGKAAFCKTILYAVIKECVLANFPRATESNIDLVIGKYLKYAPERAGGGGRKEKNDA
nr:serine/threonine-protein kinase PRP4 homolog isoform X2 [Crassostrea gigas]XP_011423799.2 serine/threonine-protein kinase PRP4 homolog isoform X2 [Crassostrea gigas]